MRPVCPRPAPVYAIVLFVLALTSCRAQPADPQRVVAPPEGTYYHGVYPGGTDGFEHSITPDQLEAYERAVGTRATWVTFSHDWFVSPEFPEETVRWIAARGAIPYVRLMMRSDAELNEPEETYTLDAIRSGRFDPALRAWGAAAARVGSPIIVEWGTEANGRWFPWNGVWNGGDGEGPEAFREAYRHVVRTVGAPNLTWVFHVNAYDDPAEAWNALENYYPGDGAVDWLGVSVYGSQSPGADAARSFEATMDRVVPRLLRMAPDKPIFVVEFGTARDGPVHQDEWARAALSSLLAGRWPAVRGFSWWNEAWPDGGDVTTMRVQDNDALAAAFREVLDAASLAAPVIRRFDGTDRLTR